MRLNRVQSTYIIAFDTINETLDYIRKGVIDATIVQKPYEMGYKAVEMMIQIQEGKTIPEINNTDTRVIHREDLIEQKGELPQ